MPALSVFNFHRPESNRRCVQRIYGVNFRLEVDLTCDQAVLSFIPPFLKIAGCRKFDNRNFQFGRAVTGHVRFTL